MVNYTIGGNNPFDVVIPQWSTIAYASGSASFSATSSTGTAQAGAIGIRKDAKFTVTTAVRNDAAGKDQTDAKDIKLEVETWQTDLPSFSNVYNLSKQFVQIAPQNQSGDWINLVDNTAQPPFAGSTASPNGSSSPGLAWEYTIGIKDIVNKLTFTTRLHPLEWDWSLANATAQDPGGRIDGQSKTLTSLSAMTYNQGAYGIPGINAISVSGDNWGLFADDIKLVLKSVPSVMDKRGRPINGYVQAEITGNWLQARYYNMQAFASRRNSDFTTSVSAWNGAIFNFVNSLSVIDNPTNDEKKSQVPFKFMGKIAYDPANVSKNIVFNFATNTVTFNRTTYQP